MINNKNKEKIMNNKLTTAYAIVLDRMLLAKHQEHTHFPRPTSVREGKVAEFERSFRKLGASSPATKCDKSRRLNSAFFLS